MRDLKNIRISELKGVGPKMNQLLNKINIYTIYDCLRYYPRAYEDLSTTYKFKEKIADKGLFYVEILSNPTIRKTRSNLDLMSVLVSDGVDTAELIFFNSSFLKKYFKAGYKKYIYGEVKNNINGLQIVQGQIIKKADIGIFNPIYNLTAGLTNNFLRKLLKLAIDEYSNSIEDYLSNELLKELKLVDLKTAIKNIHYPKSYEDLENSRKRLAFDEIFILQASLDRTNYRSTIKRGPNFSYKKYKDEINKYINSFPFSLTNAQRKVTEEIFADLESTSMNRLLQGDVGSGKTIVASLAAYLAYLNGYQTALMVPTEILAKQHFKSFSEDLSAFGPKIELLTGSTSENDKKVILDKLKNQEIDIIIGTHSLIQDGVDFNNLGLTIIDEQHRFGVGQRKTLYLKGNNPHNLSMTATPIPRTLALIIYGDMEISSIDELPPGRQPIDTIVIDDSYLNRLDAFVIKQIQAGRQAFVVCPLIEDSNTMNLNSVEKVFNRYISNDFKKNNIKTVFLHGKMKNLEKDAIMNDFARGEIDIIVSTTVIEVGINVPNANLIIIYDADRFGLSQLHQLRGRVGRGQEKSYCVLVNNNKTELAYRRMKVMKQSSDGFYISEKDLELRGQGELMGTKQHGISDFQFINFSNDLELIEFVKKNYKEIYEEIKRNKNKFVQLDFYIKDMVSDKFESEN